MRRPIIGLSAIALVALLASGVAFASLSSSSVAASTTPVTPLADWSLACLPTAKPQSVVDAYSVTTDALKELTVTRVGVKNRSTKNVIGVKLAWRLFLESEPQTSLRQGTTPLLGLPLSPGERRVIEFPVVKAANVLAKAFTSGSLRGQFRIEVAVVDVLFEENAKTSNVRESASLMKAVSWRNSSSKVEVTSYADPASMDGGGCQDQVCKWAQAQCYQCSGDAGFGCQVTNCTSCTETRCPGLE